MKNIVKKIFKTAVLTSVSAFVACFTILFTVVFSMMVLVAIVGSSDESQLHSAKYVPVYGEKENENVIYSIPITGVILGETFDLGGLNSLSFEGMTYGYEIKKDIMELADDKKSKALILEIHSPGGTIYGTQAIVDGVQYYKEKTGNPVYAYVGSIAASGGYWVATAADSIIADRGTAVGSIGVIQGPFKYYDGVITEDYGAFMGGVETVNGITTEYITSGESKDLGNPNRKLTEKERSILQKGADNIYDLFVSQVSNSRGMSKSDVEENLGAYIYDEQQALDLKLIDQLGSKEEAYEMLATQVGLQDFEVMQRESGIGILDSLLGALSSWVPLSSAKKSGNCLLHSQVLAYHGDVSSLCQ